MKRFKEMKKGFKTALLIEAALLLLVLAALFFPNKKITLNAGAGDMQTLSLPFGRYIVHTEYHTEGGIGIGIAEAEENPWYGGGVFTNYRALSPAYTEDSYEVWVTGIRTQVTMYILYSGAPGEQITSLVLEQTRFLKFLLLGIVLMAITLTLFTEAVGSGRILIKRENMIAAVSVAFIALIASIPLYTPYLSLGFDSSFHLVRVEGIKEGLLDGQFPVRIEPTYLNGYGYAVSTFYGGLFFYFPAVLRLIGFSLQTSYKVFLFCINGGMAVTSYFLFKNISKKYYFGILGSLLYTLSAYKFCNMYYRGAVAEAIAMAILPAIALAFWNVYTKPLDRTYSLRFVPLTLAFTCLLESHIISTELTGIAMLLICIVNFKKTFRKETFLVLVKFLAATIMINLFFLVPFAENMTRMKFNCNDWENVSTAIQQTGMGLGQHFYFEIPEFSYQVWYEQVYVICAGGAFLLSFVYAIAAAVTGQLKEKRDRRQLLFWLLSSLVLLIITSKFFPWDLLLSFCKNSLGRIGLAIANMVSNIQFLYRLLVLGVLFFTGLAVTALKLLENRFKRFVRIASAVIGGIMLIQYVLLASSAFATAVHEKTRLAFLSSMEGDYNRRLGMEEYIPKTKLQVFPGYEVFDERGVAAVNARVGDFKKEYLDVSFTVTSDPEQEGWIEVPVLYYLGYEMKNELTGEEISFFQSDIGRIAFLMPKDTTYEVRLSYVGKKLWKAADVISFVSLIALCVYYGAKKRKRNKMYEKEQEYEFNSGNI